MSHEPTMGRLRRWCTDVGMTGYGAQLPLLGRSASAQYCRPNRSFEPAIDRGRLSGVRPLRSHARLRLVADVIDLFRHWVPKNEDRPRVEPVRLRSASFSSSSRSSCMDSRALGCRSDRLSD